MSNYIYAQLELDTKRVVAVSVLAGEITANNMILLDSVDYNLLGKIYSEDGIFINDPNPPDPIAETPSILEQRIADLEMAMAAIMGGAV